MKSLKDKILQILEDDLKQIEKALERNLSPNLELVRIIAEHILFSGGKRLRPVLMILASRICGRNGDDLYDYSIIFEYLHSATLLHDDVVDGASLRRGKQAAYNVYGIAASVLTGDFLLARSLNISSSLRDPDIVDEVSKITADMSQGEIHQLLNKGDFSTTESLYYEIIKRKTAVLIEGACRTGARIAKTDDIKVEKLGEYGYHLGIAFQMADDLLDYVSDSKSLGKDCGADIKEGKLTLPLIHVLDKCNREDKNFLKGEIEKGIKGDLIDFQKVFSIVEQYGGLDYTKDISRKHVEKAKKALDIFPDSREKDIFFMLADYSIERSV
ncbi:MAG: polyprenyl synthetase [Deltaproteobacteria bacterium]|nr:MAG: polyprenyl synthetase [Deltaproteobacteria bacterium]